MFHGKSNAFAISKKLDLGNYKVKEAETAKWYILNDKSINVEIKEKSSNTISFDYNTFEGKKALIVDDSKLNLKVAENVLKNFLVTTESVTSGLECLSCVNSKKYDIIFMDIMMPNMSGVEVLRKLRENGVNTPVIALTADAIEGQEEKYMSEGFDGYISKPINKEKLSYVLNKYLGGK